MTWNDLKPGMQIQFMFCKKEVQGTVQHDFRIALMRQDENNRWRPIFIPRDLLDHVEFQLIHIATMPIYKPPKRLAKTKVDES